LSLSSRGVRPRETRTDRLSGLRGSHAIDQSVTDGSAAASGKFYENMRFVILVTVEQSTNGL